MDPQRQTLELPLFTTKRLREYEPGTLLTILNIPFGFPLDAENVLPHPSAGVILYCNRSFWRRGESVYTLHNTFTGYAMHPDGVVIRDGSVDVLFNHGVHKEVIPPFNDDGCWPFPRAEKVDQMFSLGINTKFLTRKLNGGCRIIMGRSSRFATVASGCCFWKSWCG